MVVIVEKGQFVIDKLSQNEPIHVVLTNNNIYVLKNHKVVIVVVVAAVSVFSPSDSSLIFYSVQVFVSILI